MTTGPVMNSDWAVGTSQGVQRPADAAAPQLGRFWFVLSAALVAAVPGIFLLGRDVWSTEQGAQGPIILSTGLWLLWREASGLTVSRTTKRSTLAVGAVLVVGLAVIFGAIIGKLWLQWAAIYACLVIVLFDFVGTAGLRRVWFPLFYLMFLIPPPVGLIVPLTRTLKLAIANWAVDLLSLAGYQVANSGASLFIDSYELVVAAACSGLNSLASLLAIGLFYAYLRHRADWRYAAFLSLLIIPIAIAANLLRVMILLLLTHYAGNEIAQGMLHEAAGLMMFVIALGTLAAIDVLLAPIANRILGRQAEL